MSLRSRLLFAPLVVSVAALAPCTAALAHIDPEPSEAPAGSLQSIGFTVEHGCDGSPTVQLDMLLPEAVLQPVAEAPSGWTGSIADTAEGAVVTFVGGPLPDDVEGTFRVQMLLPRAAGSTLYFPFVQRCEQGEIRWIDIPSDPSADELDEPAPALLLTAELPGTTDPPPATTAAPEATVAPETTDAPLATSPVPDTSAVDDGDGSSSTGAVVFVGVGLVVALGAAVLWLRSRRSGGSA